MRALGWVIAIVGTGASICVFWIDHMNPYTWRFMLLGSGLSITLGWAVARLTRSQR
jgi:hypothetical protein